VEIVGQRVTGKDQEFLKILVKEQGDIYLREIQETLEQRGVKVSVSSLCRTLKRLDLGHKKNFSSN